MPYLSELLTFVLGVIGTYLGVSWKVKRDLEAEYDSDLRKARLAVYQVLWKELEPLAKFSRPAPVTYATLKDLSRSLRSWYFEHGGIYLSESTRDCYFGVQEEIERILGADGIDDNSSLTEVAPDVFERVRKAGSTLRTAMAADVGTRKAPILDAKD